MNRRLLFISKGDDSPSTRYRAYKYFPLWREAGFDAFHVEASSSLGGSIRMLREAAQADVVIVLRKTFPWHILRLLRRASKKLIFDFDDAIFCNTDGTSSLTRLSRFNSIILCANHVFCGNSYLAEKAGIISRAVTVIPTSINLSDYDISAIKPEEYFDLVWIGSSSTRKYLEEAMPWIEASARIIKSLRLKIIADFDLPGYGVETLPILWSPTTEVQELRSSRLGIAPMHDDDWSRGKCALKVLQYMAAGLPVLSSNAGMNAEVVSLGGGGLLASTPDDWKKNILLFYENDSLLKTMGMKGRKYVEKNYSINEVFKVQLDVVKRLL